jgi:hypothetical protein
MTRRHMQLELAARYMRPFSSEASRLNRLAVQMERAQHERHRSPLAVRYRAEATAPGGELEPRLSSRARRKAHEKGEAP